MSVTTKVLEKVDGVTIQTSNHVKLTWKGTPVFDLYLEAVFKQVTLDLSVHLFRITNGAIFIHFAYAEDYELGLEDYFKDLLSIDVCKEVLDKLYTHFNID